MSPLITVPGPFFIHSTYSHTQTTFVSGIVIIIIMLILLLHSTERTWQTWSSLSSSWSRKHLKSHYHHRHISSAASLQTTDLYHRYRYLYFFSYHRLIIFDFSFFQVFFLSHLLTSKPRNIKRNGLNLSSRQGEKRRPLLTWLYLTRVVISKL